MAVFPIYQPRSQGLSSYRPLERSAFAPGGGKMKDPGNEVADLSVQYKYDFSGFTKEVTLRGPAKMVIPRDRL